MLFESMLVIIAAVVAIMLIAGPAIRLVKMLFPAKRDPLKDAREELEIAQKEIEAARLKREAEKIYSQLYTETLEESDSSDKESSRRKL